jgi:hypothetical protein
MRFTRKMSGDRAATAFLHECLHAIDELCDIELQEKQISALAPALLSFLRDNDLLKEGGEA